MHLAYQNQSVMSTITCYKMDDEKIIEAFLSFHTFGKSLTRVRHSKVMTYLPTLKMKIDYKEYVFCLK